MAKAEILDLTGFPKGLNRESDPYLLEPVEVPDALNVDFGSRGEVGRRDGYTRFDSPTDIATSSQRLVNRAGLDGTNYLIVLGGSDGKMWIAAFGEAPS